MSTILFPLLTALLCSYCIIQTDKDIADFLTENAELSLIETLRSWGKAFMWSFVFVIPGIRKFIHYTLTPYVVFFSKKYKTGEVDALEESTRVTKKYWKPVNAWITLYFVVIPVIFYMLFDDYRLFSIYPVAATGLVLLKTITEYLFNYSMLKILIKYLNETENATDNATEVASEVQNGTHV